MNEASVSFSGARFGRRREDGGALKVLLIIVFVILLVLGVIAVVAAMQPSNFRISRSSTMAAPPAAVFAQVNDLHAWEQWSPWVKIDPNATTSYEGPGAGNGAIFRWAGNSDLGKGSMTITDSRPNERIGIRLDFVEPMEDSSDIEFTFKPEGDKTLTTWTMTGEYSFIAKAICLFMDMDKMVGERFEEGLANLKAIVEKPAAAPPPSR